jgi:phage-related protein (TIGR01555 family)
MARPKKKVDIVSTLDILAPTPSPAQAVPPPTPVQGFSRMDGWSNFQKQIGTAKDSRTSTRFIGDAILPKQTLSALYVNDGLIRNIVDAIPDDMFRAGGTIENDSTDVYSEGSIAHTMRELEAFRHLNEAKKWARLTGGALLFVGISGAGAADTPLDYNSIKKIEFFKTFDLNDIQTWDCEFDTDMNSPTFGKILIYSVKVRVGTTFTEARLHASRCIPFYGQRVPSSYLTDNTLEVRHWGVSILQYQYPDIKDFRLAFANASGILQEFIIGKYKFADLDEILAAGNEAKLQARISGIEMSKSLINAVMLGVDEDYQRDSASVGGLSDLLDRFMMMVSAVSKIPVTRLFGRSASGLNATGEGDQKSYYDMLASEQTALTPEIERLIQMIAAAEGLDEEADLSWKWGNLNQLTSEQVANEERIKAETLRTNMDASQRAIAAGVMSPERVYDIFWKPITELDYEVPETYSEITEEDNEEITNEGNAEIPTQSDKSEISNSKTSVIVSS